MTLNLRQIDAFRMVMLRGSVTAAAGALNVSQPAVSRLIRDLESDAALTLFQRRGNHLVPTPEASLLLAEVERYAVGLASLTTFARDLANRKLGALRVVAMPAMAMAFLPRFLATFLDGRALSRVFVHGMPSHLVIDAVTSGQADVGFAASPSDRPGLTIEPIAARAMVVMRRDHKLANRRRIRIEDIVGEPVVAMAEPTIFVGPVPEALDVKLRTATIVTPLSGIACQFVAAGAGVAVIDPFSIVGAADPNLVGIPFEPAIRIRVAIVSSAMRQPSSLALEFISELKTHVARIGERRIELPCTKIERAVT